MKAGIYVVAILLALYAGIGIVHAAVNPANTFVETFNTLMPGSASNTLTLPISGSYNVYWGDGTNTIDTATHVYASGGVYTVNIINLGVTSFSFNNGGDKSKLISINQWGNMTFGNSGGYFYGANNMNVIATDSPSLIGTNNLESMFEVDTAFNGNIAAWNTNSVTNMAIMFKGASAFNQNIAAWNTNSVTNMGSMFYSDSAFNQPIGTWNTNSVTNMGSMFQGASAFNGNIATWNTNSVTDMFEMFTGASAFNQPIGTWNTMSVTNMGYMFNSDSAFNQPIGTWNTNSVTDMSGMFDTEPAFNQNIATWNTNSVTDMSDMFAYATSFNQNIATWNTNSVTNMGSMFQSDSAFNQNIGTWNTMSVTNMANMFTNTGLSTPNYDALLAGWGIRNQQSSVSFGAGSIQYSNCGAAGHSILVTTFLWSITDGGENTIYQCEITISPSNSIADAGQYESFNGVMTGAVTPYNALLRVVNSVTPSIIVYTASLTFTGNSWSFNSITIPSYWSTNSPLSANVVLMVDGGYETNSIFTSNINIGPALTTPTLSPGTATIDSGQSLTETASWTGGTKDYTVNWYTGPSGNTCAQDSANVLATYSSITGTSNALVISPTTTNSYCAGVTDSASTPVTLLSTNSVVTVNNAVVAGAITPSAPTINSGQSTTLTAHASEGTTPYTYNWYTIAGTTAPSCTPANQITGQNANTITVSPISTNSYAYQVTDSSPTNSIACSAGDEVTIKTGFQATNPYKNGPTGFFGHLLGNSTAATSSTTSTVSTTTSAAVTIPEITSSGATVSKLCNNTAGYNLVYPSLNVAFHILPASSACFNVTATNVTSAYAKQNRSVIKVINYSVSNKNISSNVTIHYACNINYSNVYPSIFRNGTWQRINPFIVNASACTVEFAVPSDPVIGLFTSNVSSSTVTSSANTATTIQSTVSSVSAVQQNNSILWEAIVAVIVIIIVVVALLIYLRNR